MLTRAQLLQIDAEVGERRGWDFSRVQDDIDPVPWRYSAVVRAYVQPGNAVLDLGTGGGERFRKVAAAVRRAVGVDLDRAALDVARRVGHSADLVQARGQALPFPAACFDVVLSRHAPVWIAEAARVLRPGGVFVTQQIGPENAANIGAVFGCEARAAYACAPDQQIAAWAGELRARGFAIRAQGAYNVPYFYCDAASLVFWLKAIPVPADFEMARHWEQVARIIDGSQSPRGIATNVHRELLVAQKPSQQV